MEIPRVNLPAAWQCLRPADWPATERDYRSGRRIIVFVLVLVCGLVLTHSGRDLQTVLETVVGLGLAGATIARWVADGSQLPSLASLLVRHPGGAA